MFVECSEHVLTPFHAAINILVALFVAASYTPPIRQLAQRDDHGATGISGWYILLLILGVNSHLMAWIFSAQSFNIFACISLGELQGRKAFSALAVILPLAIQFLAAATFLVSFMLSRRRQQIARTEHLPSTEKKSGTARTSPSNGLILATSIIHMAIFLAPAVLLILLVREELSDEGWTAVLAMWYSVLATALGVFPSLAAFIPQIRLMIHRHREGLRVDQGALSITSLALQGASFTALAVSQIYASLNLQSTDAHLLPVFSEEWWSYILWSYGLAAGWISLAFSQLIVLTVLLRLGGGGTLHMMRLGSRKRLFQVCCGVTAVYGLVVARYIVPTACQGIYGLLVELL
ncbi:uncharacterized protein DSM5745_11364 [Aspergillus mulundensis]|uniref:Uncharacterized protein n=1 Tax=Aspergillus mulundensis TaxID=1810919 RepID=A0A3D8Q7N7_9EURO|nr:hypothetical protein DSM5745_11364 [Aspergillus mulundensis]RDW57846.1 hypothetical protein DSM5745_11364 [Aspergillus mulundensis]